MGQMTWLDSSGHQFKILYLRASEAHPWQPYTAFPHLRQPDLQIKGASKGYTTMQYLLKRNWQLVATAAAQSQHIEDLTQSLQIDDEPILTPQQLSRFLETDQE